jgi:hypothetical protein
MPAFLAFDFVGGIFSFVGHGGKNGAEFFTGYE